MQRAYGPLHKMLQLQHEPFLMSKIAGARSGLFLSGRRQLVCLALCAAGRKGQTGTSGRA